MLVSILMGVYNGAATLDKAVESVLNQTHSEFEFIICDDASTDNSWEILSRYMQSDQRIRLLRNEKNSGLGYSLNRCLEAASGDYIARQDADDISMPERLEKSLQYLLDNNLPYMGCGVRVFDSSGVWSRRLFPELITKRIIAQKNPFFHPTMVFRREIMQQAGGYRVTRATRRTEDYDLVMRLAGRGIIGRNMQAYLYDVYEPKDAYRRHTWKTRCYEVGVRFKGLRVMHSPPGDYIYLIKPIIMALVPRALIRHIKRIQWGGVRAER